MPDPAVESAGIECDKTAVRGEPIQHQVADIRVSKAGGRQVLLPRLTAFVLACALLLLPLLGSVPHLDGGDRQGQQTRIDATSPVLVLSNRDITQAALRNAEAKHSGKTADGAGKATLAFGAQLPEPGGGRLVSRTPHEAGVPKQAFLAFSARAPPL